MDSISLADNNTFVLSLFLLLFRSACSCYKHNACYMEAISFINWLNSSSWDSDSSFSPYGTSVNRS